MRVDLVSYWGCTVVLLLPGSPFASRVPRLQLQLALTGRFMRPAVGLILALIFCTSAADAAPKLLWEAKGLAQPESVVQDPATGAIYVSNINGAIMQKDGNGFIAKL